MKLSPWANGKQRDSVLKVSVRVRVVSCLAGDRLKRECWIQSVPSIPSTGQPSTPRPGKCFRHFSPVRFQMINVSMYCIVVGPCAQTDWAHHNSCPCEAPSHRSGFAG
jgi:hypothetical protein